MFIAPFSVIKRHSTGVVKLKLETEYSLDLRLVLWTPQKRRTPTLYGERVPQTMGKTR